MTAKLIRYLKRYGPSFLAILIIVCLVFGIVTVSRSGITGRIGNISKSLSSPVQRATEAAVSWMESLYNSIYDYERLAAENEQLRGEITELESQIRDYDDLSEENERLRVLLNLREQHRDFTYESAKLVSWDSSVYTSAFTISKGSGCEIEVGDCVVTEYGVLVGQVSEVSESSAVVRTVVDLEFSCGILVGEDSYSGMVEGNYELMNNTQVKMTYLASGARIYREDEVITSGKGGSFPAGLTVGKVSEVMTEAGGQVTYGIVEPACDYTSLTQVFVIKDFDIVE